MCLSSDHQIRQINNSHVIEVQLYLPLKRSRRRVYFSCIIIVRVKNVLFMACSCCVTVILRRCISIIDVVLIIVSRTCTPNALRMTREGDTRCIEIRFPLACTIRCARTSVTRRHCIRLRSVGCRHVSRI